MIRRNAPIAKIITAALCILAVVYLLYIFNETSGKLKDTERVAHRYRREQEALSSQLSDLRLEKENLQQRCDNERKEYQTRLSSSNQQYKMLQSQNEDLQSDHSRLRNDCNKEKEDHKLHDSQQNQEYMQLKQEKELEISSLKDEVANIKREKDTLNDEISKLKYGLENSQKNWKLENKERLSLEKQVGYLKKEVASYQMSVNSMQEQNRAFETKIGFLQAQQQQQKQLILQQQNLQQQQQKQQVLQQQQQQNIPQNNQQQPVVNGNIVNNLQNAANQVGGNIQNAANQFAGNLQHMAKNMGGGEVGGFIKSLEDKVNELSQKDKVIVQMDQNKSQQEKEKEKAQELEKKNKLIDEQQQQHQVLPPNRNGNADDDKAEEWDKELAKFKESQVQQKEEMKEDHDNRIQNQGPVGLQVQEPVLHKEVAWKDDNNNKKLDNNPNVDAQEDQNNAEEVNEGDNQQVEDRRNEKHYYDEDEDLNEAKLDNNDPDIKKKDFRR